MRLGFNKFIECPRDLELPQVTAARIRDMDEYYGYLAWSEVFINENLVQKGIHVLQELIRCFPTRPEAYFKLWQHYNGQKQHKKSLQVAAECFLRITEYPEYTVITSLNLAKSNFNLENIRKALNLLQEKHCERPTFTVYLYQYGKLCIKSDQVIFVPTGIGALKEVLRSCDKERVGKVHYWLYKGYLILQENVSAMKACKICVNKVKSQKKLEEAKNELKRFQKLINNLQAAEQWLADLKNEKWDKFKSYCEEVANFDKLHSYILMAKGLWSLGKDSEAIEYLIGVLPSTTLPQGYFCVLSYLFNKEDYRTAHRLSKIMLSKSKNSPIQIWIKAYIFHAYSLFHNSKPLKALTLLKCLGKTFPYLPYTFTPYIQQLRKATCIEHLGTAAERASQISVNYEETSYQFENIFTPNYLQSLNENKLNNQEICRELMQEDCVITETGSSVGLKIVNLSEVFNRYKNSKESSMGSMTSEKVYNVMKSYENHSFSGYSISSKTKFLYLIAKFASIASVCIEDGLCAIEDYLNLLQSYPKKKKKEIKAILIKGKLLLELKDYSTAIAILNEILPDIQRYNMKSKEAQINSILFQYSNINL